MHDEEHEERANDEAKMDAQLKTISKFKGKIAIIPGNHDWHRGKDDGLEYVNRQEEYIEKEMGKDVFLPSNGCPGPEVLKLGRHLAIIIIDTQWRLHQITVHMGSIFGSARDSL
jgi:hypothetical protein